ncbi:MAG: FAD:protein FMN transferase [Gammaproteobacteria bacterium]|nr:FAD:protein FMN transferase [Gammaproteobacteria bacterium]
MGTQYRVTADCPVDVGGDIARELAWVNQEMSTYDESSTLSRFNRSMPGGWFAVSADLVAVVAAGTQLSAVSAGAFDITVGPLVNLWGFGPGGVSAVQPTPEQVNAALARVGHGHLEYRVQPPALLKHEDVYVDLSAIAKGYGVDRLAELLNESACGDFIVEIGGEVRTRGTNERGALWRVGVEVPDPESFGAVQRVLHLEEYSVATSGDYRNFFARDGARFSHTIDPRTGRPVDHQLASVTVAHDSAMWADGYATLLNVLGPQAGLAFAQETGLAVLFIVRTEHGFEERYTEPMQPFLGSL